MGTDLQKHRTGVETLEENHHSVNQELKNNSDPTEDNVQGFWCLIFGGTLSGTKVGSSDIGPTVEILDSSLDDISNHSNV